MRLYLLKNVGKCYSNVRNEMYFYNKKLDFVVTGSAHNR